MGYRLDLDEYPDEQLQRELNERKLSREQGLCDYCHRKPSEPACRFPERHKLPKKKR